MKYIAEITPEKIRVASSIAKERLKLYKDQGMDFLASRDFMLNEAGRIREKILDVGSGRGVTVIALAKSGYHVTSIDTQEEMLENTALNAAGEGLLSYLDLYRMDVSSLEFKDNSFNSIFMVEVLHHLENIPESLSEINRVLSDPGKIILSDFNDKGIKRIEAVHSRENRKHEGSFTGKKKVRAWLKDNGFIVREYEHICHWVIVAEKTAEFRK